MCREREQRDLIEVFDFVVLCVVVCADDEQRMHQQVVLPYRNVVL